jgi:beta-ureidopropionase / N-carbamoyl-L-amino-acid hydrolase
MNRREFNLSLFATVAATLVKSTGAQTKLRVNGARINAHLAALGEFGKNPQGGVSRLAYSEADLQGRKYAMALMREAKLEVSIDLVGNIVGRRAGTEAALPALVIGSHIDSVPEGGNYDGDVGSMGAIEVAQTLAENNVKLRHPLEVLIFQNEEGGTIGSQLISGELPENQLELPANSGKTIREGIKLLGGDPTRLAEARRKRGEIAAYLELHIEQGGILDTEKINIGVVQGIVGISHWEVTIEGFANHAGTTPMNQRHDALLAAARFIDAVNRVVISMVGGQVGTVGKIQALPGAYNVIPGKVVVGLELRDLDTKKVQLMFDRIRAEAARIAASNGTTFDFKQTSVSYPALTDERIRRLIDETAKGIGLSTKHLPSGAGHDAQEIARLGPVGMIFIPSVGGISHSPREFSRPEDIANGANVLLQALIGLDTMILR